ncbi:MAG: 50S ribosomal protein L29 [Candidatus Magasanikbacteria bacterium]|nr:50S ribosomal protein L29 [Candidatus Magasanikbacteria bacterium]
MKEKIETENLNEAELKEMLRVERGKLRELRFRVASRELKTVHEINKTKKRIARLLTVLEVRNYNF